jgi:CheY-like chemotaxis protein
MATILVIDDEPALRAAMRRALERAGHTVLEAANGSVAIPMIEKDRPDAVVTDLFMPEKEGIETIMELRERFADLPIVAVSGALGGDESGPLKDAQIFGASAVLPKPFSIDQFVKTVEGVLPKARS